jgi:hypothetical protein
MEVGGVGRTFVYHWSQRYWQLGEGTFRPPVTTVIYTFFENKNKYQK